VLKVYRGARPDFAAIPRPAPSSLVAPLGEGAIEGAAWIAREFVAGEALGARLAAARATLREVVALVARAARAVAELHDRGLCHGNLKPGNVVAIEARVALLDAGLALPVPPESGEPGLVPPLLYRAPEQLDRGGPSPKADVYALGAVLYEALAGRPPFRAATPADLADAIRSRDPIPPSGVRETPRDLEMTCLLALEKSPDDRIATAAEFAEGLERWLEGRAASTTRRLRVMGWLRKLWEST
jgi:serine/threonine protein kinase